MYTFFDINVARESWSWATGHFTPLRLHLKKLAEKESNIASITAAWRQHRDPT